jgi:hypothetical protein
MSKVEEYTQRLNWYRLQQQQAKTRGEKQRYAKIVAALVPIIQREAAVEVNRRGPALPAVALATQDSRPQG